MTRRKLLLFLVFLCLLGSVGSNIAGSYFSSRVIINNIVGRAYETVPQFAAALLTLLGIYAVGVLCTYLQSAIMVQLAQRGVNQLRRDLFDKLQDLPLQYFDQHAHGELMSRFTNDADSVQMALEQSVISLFSSVLMFAGIVTVMLVVNPLLFLVTCFTLACTFLVFRVFGGKSRTYYRKQQAALGAVNGNIQEMIGGLRVVKAFTYEAKAKADFDRLNSAYRDAAMDAHFYSSAVMPMAMNLMNVGYALTAAFGGFLAIVRGFDLGGLVLYLNYSKQVGQPLNQISQQLTTIFSALAGAERIFAAMDEPPEVDDGAVTLVPAAEAEDGTLQEDTGPDRARHWAWKVPQGARFRLAAVARDGAGRLAEVSPGTPGHLWAWRYETPEGGASLHQIRGRVNPDAGGYILAELRGAVRLKDVGFSYVAGKPVLKQVSVYANPGQKIAFVGSTGAGKTTITNLINRFYEIDSGAITYDGIDVRDIEKASLRRSLGAVLQDTHLFTGTVMDNIRYGRLDASDEDCIAAARSAGAHSFIRRLPDGYQTPVTRDGANLSQGQRQLLAIARAAVADPPVMVLDEATSSIDTRTERLIEKGMDALMENRTVFVIAHRLSTVRNANAIIVIEGGEIQERGDHEELLAQKGRYYQLYTGQFELD
ncbi:MAG: ABC transporter ATP-binding protein [Clostridiales bacterium]|nr:ABC transporter ATP-binding protein [Clostridiales bacterium]